MMKPHSATLYTDGGARGNPGPAGYGFVLTQAGKPVIEEGGFLQATTNNQAEYTALLRGLTRAYEEGVRELHCFLDSELVVKQINGEYRVKDEKLKPLFEKVRELSHQFTTITFTHVPRAQNKRADKLVNEAIDKALKA